MCLANLHNINTIFDGELAHYKNVLADELYLNLEDIEGRILASMVTAEDDKDQPGSNQGDEGDDSAYLSTPAKIYTAPDYDTRLNKPYPAM